MAYSTAYPPVRVYKSRNGSAPSIWSYESTDPVSTVTGSGYFSNAVNVGLKVGDIVHVNESDNGHAPVTTRVTSISSGAATVSASDRLETEAGTGITGGTGTVYKSGVERYGDIIKTSILLDVTGLRSSAIGDILGVDATSNPCHLGQITAARNGTVFAGRMTCIEVPAGGDPDIDLYSADEATGVENGAIIGLSNTVQLVDAGDWTAGAVKALGVPAADQYLYGVNGALTDADYTAGKFLIEFYGYV